MHDSRDLLTTFVGLVSKRSLVARAMPRRRTRGFAVTVAGLVALVALAGAIPAATAARATAAPSASPTPAGPRDSVLRGEVVETGCFVIGGRKGETHRHCALTCALAGEPLGILDDETKLLYVVVQDFTSAPQANPLLPFVAQKVELRGVTIERGGVNGVIVRQVKPVNPPAKR
jgi:hypothetical protein